MAKIKVTLEIYVPDIEAEYRDWYDFIWFYICQEGSIKQDNPLYDTEYTIIDFDWD